MYRWKQRRVESTMTPPIVALLFRTDIGYGFCDRSHGGLAFGRTKIFRGIVGIPINSTSVRLSHLNQAP
jgi:hypothetical protein